MKNLEKSILELIPEKNQERAKDLINKLKLDAVEEYKLEKFKGRSKKYQITIETKETLEKFMNKEIKTKEVLNSLGMSKAKGNRNNFSKLTEVQVKEIKYFLKDKVKQQTIADKYNVKLRTIKAIQSGQNWNHITIE